MLPGNSLLVKCPHCKGVKELMTLVSGNTFGGRQWWDLKTEYPMLPHVSWVQRCPHCGNYYMYLTAKSREGDGYSGERGELTYEQMRQAWAQLKDVTKKQHKNNLMLEYVWAYNDEFQRGGWADVCPTPEELEEFRAVVRELVSVFPVESPMVHAEFLREAGLFQEAMEIVEKEEDKAQGIYKTLAGIIREKCAQNDTSVGRIERQ